MQGAPAGFSLIELIVSVGIIVLLSLAVFPAFASYRTSRELDHQADLLASLIRRAQNEVVTGGVGGAVGAGVRIWDGQADGAAMFSDLDGDHAFVESELIAGSVQQIGPQVEVLALSPRAVAESGVVLDVVFSAPEAEVWVNGVRQGNAAITLQLTAGQRSREVRIDGLSGRIEVR